MSIKISWDTGPSSGYLKSFYARRTAPEQGVFDIYCTWVSGNTRCSYGWHVAGITDVPAAVYDETMFNMIAIAEAKLCQSQ